MKTRLAKLLTAAVPVALVAAAIVPGPAAASKPTGNTQSTGGTTSTTTTTSPTVSNYCGSGYTLVGQTSSYYKLAYDKNADGYVCVKVARKSVSYTDDFSQLIML
jgi:hypothetical protein